MLHSSSFVLTGRAARPSSLLPKDKKPTTHDPDDALLPVIVLCVNVHMHDEHARSHIMVVNTGRERITTFVSSHSLLQMRGARGAGLLSRSELLMNGRRFRAFQRTSYGRTLPQGQGMFRMHV